MVRADTDPDLLFYEGFQLRDELRDVSEVVFTERLATIILDVLPY